MAKLKSKKTRHPYITIEYPVVNILSIAVFPQSLPLIYSAAQASSP
ncbi:hypothetical protein MMA231_03386 [Asticcacaulis sp. MM231]